MRITIELEGYQFNGLCVIARGILTELELIRELIAERAGPDPANITSLTQRLKTSETALRAAIATVQPLSHRQPIGEQSQCPQNSML